MWQLVQVTTTVFPLTGATGQLVSAKLCEPSELVWQPLHSPLVVLKLVPLLLTSIEPLPCCEVPAQSLVPNAKVYPVDASSEWQSLQSQVPVLPWTLCALVLVRWMTPEFQLLSQSPWQLPHEAVLEV